VWLHAARNVCMRDGVPSCWFPLEDMAVPDLEHLALSPSRYVKFSRANATRAAYPARTQTFSLINPFDDGEELVMDEVHLLPGGRYLVGRCNDGIAFWDMGYNAGMPAKARAFASIPTSPGTVICAPQPTLCGQGILVGSLDNGLVLCRRGPALNMT
jgi:hypothetical protein